MRILVDVDVCTECPRKECGRYRVSPHAGRCLHAGGDIHADVLEEANKTKSTVETCLMVLGGTAKALGRVVTGSHLISLIKQD